MQGFRVNKVNSIMEAVNWVCDDARDNHEWVRIFPWLCKKPKVLEALQYDIEIPCVVQ